MNQAQLRTLHSTTYILTLNRAGESTSAAITSLGKVYTWGLGTKGQLGLGYAPQSEKALFDAWDDVTNFVDPPRPGATGANQVAQGLWAA